MTDNDPQTQLVKYLTDVHSIEEQALVQMRRAPGLVEGEFAESFRRHLGETETQEQRVRERLEAHDASPSKLKDVAGRAGGFGMVLFARSQPDTPGKLAMHAFSYEHMEVAAYELLGIAAREAGDEATVAMAAAIADEEREMADRIAARWDEAVEQSLAKIEPDDLGETLNTYLADLHALEGQSQKLLEKGSEMDIPEGLRAALADHLAETEGHLERIERRLDDRGATASGLKDAALRLGALNWGVFFAAQPDSPAKLAGFAYAVENLEVAAYELVLRVARRAGDGETVALAEEILGEEKAAAVAVGALGEGVEVEAVEGLAEALPERVPELDLAADPGGEHLQLQHPAERGVAAQLPVRLQPAEALGDFDEGGFELAGLDIEPFHQPDQRLPVGFDLAADLRQRRPELGVAAVARPQPAGELDAERGPRQVVVEVDSQQSVPL